jgi:hypothetical protein
MVMSRLLVSLLAVLPLLISADPAAARQESPAPLDLAAMVLTPADLATVGWDGLGLQSGQLLAVTDLAARAVWPSGAGAAQDAVRDDLRAAGWQQGYTVTLATLWDPSRSDLGRQVEIELDAYGDAAGAAQGLALVPDVFPTGPITPVTGEREIGEASRLVRVAARDPQAGTPNQELALGFRVDHLTAHILLRDWSDEPPAVATIEALAERLLGRIEQVLRDGEPGLSLHALPLEPREHAAQTAAYLRIDGADVRSSYESSAEFAARVLSYGTATDVFTSTTEIEATDGGDPLKVDEELLDFADATQAATWLRAAPERVGQDAEEIISAVEDDVAGIGDEAVVATVTRDPDQDGIGLVHTAAVLVRVGAQVAVIRLTRANDPPAPSATMDLARAQVACVIAECLRPQPAPRSLIGDLPEDAHAATPNSEPGTALPG